MKISIIGGGAMGTAIVEGLLANGNYSSQNINISNPHTEKLSKLVEKGVNVFSSNIKAIKDADVVILAVKPWFIPDVIDELSPYINLEDTEVCSIAAGITSRDLINLFGNKVPASLTIAIPNTAMKVRESMTFIVPIKGSSIRCVEIFEKLGKVMVIDEDHLQAATALASCGIAFAMRYVRAACEGGVELGIKADVGKKILCQTLLGTAALLSAKESHPETEIDKVTTPGGITIKGLNTMEKFGFTTSVIEGLKACKA